ncbi:MAG: PA14 domain-containing protein [Patescibacteria group bacterium]|jgi:fibro-slime domain-containing protein|nr:PA14 domain-containing protein [Patescibacteria group bacterium]
MNQFLTKNLVNLAKKLLSYQVVIALIIGILAPFSLALAAAPTQMEISNIVVARNDNTATISWHTNKTSQGRVEYGLESKRYIHSLSTNAKKTDHAITIQGLYADTDYYFRIIAWDDNTEITSFEQKFTTQEGSDKRAPVISNVEVAYVTGGTATIQWLTNEDATTEVEYGLDTTYKQKKTNNNKVRVHDITLTNLVDSTYYHFRVRSTDKDNNTAIYYDLTFRTKTTSSSDKEELIIYNVEPSSTNDSNVTTNSAVISWRTNKLSEGWIRYSKTTALGKTIQTTIPRDFTHSITLTGLDEGATYYFDILAKDVFGKQVRTDVYSFTTKATQTSGSSTSYPAGTGTGQILGSASCDINLSTDFGYWANYYNLTSDHPDVDVWKNDVKLAYENDWYDSKYFAFSRVDKDIIHENNFFPVDEGKPGDPNGFAVYWRGILDIPENGNYTYQLASDDDSWLFIDGQLILDLHGIHRYLKKEYTVTLNKGYHTVEIYYADRQKTNALISFIPESRIKVHPLPDGCSIQDVLDYNNLLAKGGVVSSGTTQTSGQVLGVKVTTQPASPYVCNPNSGYTRFKALYKTTDSPDIWAILETGQRHYITSPESFYQYGCQWSEVQIVSRAKLESYPSARLIRTPNDPTVYYLFQRPQVQWLKINIPSPTVFVSYPGNYWGNVARVTKLDVDAYPAAELIKTAGNSNVYKVEGSTKQLIPNQTVFEKYNYEWAEVVELNQTHFDYYELGSNLQ